MVAIVSGSAAGLFNASSSILGQQGLYGQATYGQANERIFINSATGNLIVQNNDETLSALGADFGVLRTYNSLGSLNDGNGNNDHWRLGFLSNIDDQGGIATRITADGAEQRFQHTGGSVYSTNTDGAGAHDTLTKTPEGWVYTEGSSQIQMHYDAQGRLVALLDKDGQGSRFSYDQDDVLTHIVTDTDAGQETSVIEYDENGNIHSILLLGTAAEAQRAYYYEYDTEGRLSSVTVDLSPSDDTLDSEVYETHYTYVATSGTGRDQLKSIAQSDGSYVEFDYYGLTHADAGKIKTVTRGTPGSNEAVVTQYSYAGQDTLITTGGQTVSFTHDAQGRLIEKSTVVDAMEVSTTYSYNAQGDVETVTDGLNNTTHFGYDNGNLVWQQDAQGNRLERDYNDKNQLLIERLYITPDTDKNHLDATTEASDPAVTRYIYDAQGTHLRFVITPEGNVTEFRYNTFNQRSEQRVYARFGFNAVNDLADDAVPSITDMEDWALNDAQGNRRVFGESDVQITTYTYHFRGQLETQTLHQAVDSEGDAHQDAEWVAKRSVTVYAYDMHGRLLSETHPDNQYTAYTYDGLGRVLSQFESYANEQSSNELTENIYLDSQQKIRIQQRNGLVTTSSYDSAGRLIGLAYGIGSDNGKYGQEAFYYDEQGQQVAQKHQNGAISYTFYDEGGRLQFSVDRSGAVTRFHYNLAGQLTKTESFATKVITSSWLVEQSVDQVTALNSVNNIATSNDDRKSWHYYDDAGRKLFDVDGDNYITEYRYDGAGRLTHTIQYDQIHTVEEVIPSPAFTDITRVTRTVYNDNGQIIATIDGHGYVTELAYDNAGQLIEQKAYANVKLFAGESPTPAQIASLTLPDLLPSPDNKDRLTHYLYDGKGQHVASVSPEGAVIRYTYTNAGQLNTQVTYTNRVINYTRGDTLTLPQASEQDIHEAYTYNTFGAVETYQRTSGSNASVGQLTTYSYNEQGQVIGTIVSELDGTQARSELYGLDEMGRVTGTLDGEESTDVVASKNAIATALQSAGNASEYDELGRLIKSVDRQGSATFYYYDARDRLAASISADGRVQQFNFNAFGELTVIRSYTNKLPGSTINTLNGGDVDTIDAHLTDLAQNNEYSETTNVYDNRGLLNAVLTNAGGKRESQHNGFGEIEWTDTYLTSDFVNTRRDAFGYDNRGYLTSTVIDENGEAVVSSTKFDAFGRVSTQTDAAGNVVTFNYEDTTGTTTTQYASANGLVTESTTIDVFGRVVLSQDGAGVTTRMEFDGDSRSKIVEDGNGNGVKYVYNVHGQVEFAHSGALTAYDANDNPLASLDDPARVYVDIKLEDRVQTRHYEYDHNGQITFQTVGTGQHAVVTQYTYYDDQRLHTERTVGLANSTTTYVYDNDGNVVSRANSLGESHFGYDGQGRLTYAIDNSRALTTYTYDAVGRKTSESKYIQAVLFPLTEANLTTAMAGEKHSTYYRYDAAGRLIATIDAEGALTVNHYNARGLVNEQVRYSEQITLTPDMAARLVTGLNNDGQLSAELESDLATYIDQASGDHDQVTSTVYNALGQARYSLQKIGTQAIVKESTFDAAGRLVNTHAYAQTIPYLTDYILTDANDPDTPQDKNLANILASLPQHNDRQTWFYYDGAGRLRFSVNSLGQVSETQYNDAGQASKTVQYATSLNDNVDLAAQYSNGSLSLDALTAFLSNHPINEPDDRVTRTHYTAAGQIERIEYVNGHNESGQEIVVEESWTYYDNGLKASFTNKAGNTWRYVYDDGGRLTREFSPLMDSTWAADWSDSNNPTYNEVEQVRAVKAYEYDGSGNVLSITEGYVQNAAAWDELALTSWSAMDIELARSSTFDYDAMGRQVQVIEPTATNAPAVTSNVTYDALGNAVVNELISEDAQGQPLQVYQYNVYDSVGNLVYSIDAEGYVTQFGYDALGHQETLTRYANAFDLDALKASSWTIGSAISIEQVQSFLVVDASGKDRTVTTEYNALGQKVSVKQPEIQFGYVNNQGTVYKSTGQPETKYFYNTFGEIRQTDVKVTQTKWASTFQYYDNAGRKTLEVDAEGYVSQWEYNEFGQVDKYTEYATALGTIDPLVQPVPSTTEGSDRIWTYAYDALGRKVEERQLDVQHHAESGWALTGDDSDDDNRIDATTSDYVTTTQYDNLGNVTGVDHNGVQTQTRYDVLGRVEAVVQGPSQVVSDPQSLLNSDLSTATSSVSSVKTFHYDIHGNLISTKEGEADVNGDLIASDSNRIAYQFFNTKNQTIRSEDAEGGITTFAYDYAGNVTEQTRHYVGLEETSFLFSSYIEFEVSIPYQNGAFDSVYRMAQPSWMQLDTVNGQIKGVAKQNLSAILKIEVRDVAGHLQSTLETEVNLSKGESFTVDIDSWDPAYGDVEVNQKAVATYQYDKLGNQSQLVMSREKGSKTIVESQLNIQYNAFGEIKAKGDPFFNSSTEKPLQETYVYNNAGQLISSDIDGQTVSDIDGERVKDTFNETKLYDLQGNLVQSEKTGQGQSANRYDLLGRVVEQYKARFVVDGETLSPEISQDYDRWGNIISYTDPRGYVTNYVYDNRNNIITEKRSTAQSVDEKGVVSLSRPTTEYFYDLDGRHIATQNANGHFSFSRYTTLGQLSHTRDETGNTVSRGYNIFGEQIALENALGYITTTSYDKLGRITATGDIRSNDGGQDEGIVLNQYQYNALGQRVVQTDALGNQYYYQYDSQGNLLKSISPSGLQKSYQYDRKGNRIEEVYEGLHQGNSNTHRNNWQHNYLGQVKSLNDLGGNTTEYHYVHGNLATKSIDIFNDGSVDQNFEYDYYSNGLLKRVEDTTHETFTEYKYNASGQVVEEERYTKNALDDITHEIVSNDYDSLGRLRQVVVTDKEQDKVLSAVLYNYDKMGNRRSIQVLNGYSGNITQGGNVAPVLNPEYEGAVYPIATKGYTYHAEIGDITNIFYDENEGEIPTITLVAMDINGNPLETVPDWIYLDEIALADGKIILRADHVPINAPDNTYLGIKATDANALYPDAFTILPLEIITVDNQAPKFIDLSGFGEIDPLVKGLPYPTPMGDTVNTWNLTEVIKNEEDDEGTSSLQFQIGSLDPEIAEWLEFTYDSVNQSVTVQTREGKTVPTDFDAESLVLKVFASDGSKNELDQLLWQDFDLTFAVIDEVIATPEDIYLAEYVDSTDIADLSTWFNVNDGYRLEIVEVLEELENPSLALDGFSLTLSTEEGADTSSTISQFNFNVYREGTEGEEDTLVYQSASPVTVNIDRRPKTDQVLSDVVLNSDGTGSFIFEAFTDANNDELAYEFFAYDLEDNLLTFPSNSFSLSEPEIINGKSFFTVNVTGAEQLAVSAGKIHIIAIDSTEIPGTSKGELESSPLVVNFEIAENSAPIISGSELRDVTIDEGKTFKTVLTASDLDGDALTWSYQVNSDHGTVKFYDSETGAELTAPVTGNSVELSFTPKPTWDGTTSNLVVTVTDDSDNKDEVVFVLDLNERPKATKEQMADYAREGIEYSHDFSQYFSDDNYNLKFYVKTPNSLPDNYDLDPVTGEFTVTFPPETPPSMQFEVYAKEDRVDGLESESLPVTLSIFEEFYPANAIVELGGGIQNYELPLDGAWPPLEEDYLQFVELSWFALPEDKPSWLTIPTAGPNYQLNPDTNVTLADHPLFLRTTFNFTKFYESYGVNDLTENAKKQLSLPMDMLVSLSAFENTLPVIAGDDVVPLNTLEDEVASINFSASDVDEGDLTWSIDPVSITGLQGTFRFVDTATGLEITEDVIGNNVEIEFNPAENWYGTGSFEVTVTDRHGGEDKVTVNVTVDAVNDIPEPTQTLKDFKARKGNAFEFNFKEYFEDVEGDDFTLTIIPSGETNPLPAYLDWNGTTGILKGTFDSYADIGYQFDVVATETSPGSQPSAPMTVVISVAEPAIEVNASLKPEAEEDHNVIDGLWLNGMLDFVKLEWNDTTSQPSWINFVLNEYDLGNTIRLTPDAGVMPGIYEFYLTATLQESDYLLNAEENSSVTEEQKATKDVVVTVIIEENVSPVISGNEILNKSINEDASLYLNLSATDANLDDDLTWTLQSKTGLQGTVVISPSPDGKGAAITFDPKQDWSGQGNFVIKVSDGDGGEDTVTVNVTVTPKNDAPTISQGSGITVDMNEDDASSFNLTLTATDVESDTLHWSISSQASNGTASVSGTGTNKAISYSPNANFSGQDTFNVLVDDKNGGTDSIKITVNVKNINDDPIIQQSSPLSQLIDFNSSHTFSINADDKDLVYGDSLSWSIKGGAGPSNGTVITTDNNTNATFKYTPTTDWHGQDSFTVVVKDQNNRTDEIVINVTVSEPENTAPYIKAGAPDSITLTEGYQATIPKSTFQGMFGDNTDNGPLKIEFQDLPAFLTENAGSLSGLIKVGQPDVQFKVRAVDSKDEPSNWHQITLKADYPSLSQGDIALSSANNFLYDLNTLAPVQTQDITVVSDDFVLNATSHLISINTSSKNSGVESESITIKYLLESGETVQKNVNVTYDHIPEFSTSEWALDLEAGQSGTVYLPTATDHNASDNEALQYSWHAGVKPGGLNFAGDPPRLVGTANLPSSGWFEYKVTDPSGDSAIQRVTWEIKDTTAPEEIGGRQDIDVAWNGSASVYLPNFFSDNVTDSANLTYEYWDGVGSADVTSQKYLEVSNNDALDGRRLFVDVSAKDDAHNITISRFWFNFEAKPDDGGAPNQQPNSMFIEQPTTMSVVVEEGEGGETIWQGDTASDTYNYSLSDGNIIIEDTGGVDTLVLGTGILPEDVSIVAMNNGNMTISFVQGTTITVRNWYSGGYSPTTLEFIQFDNGDVWDKPEIGRRMTIQGSANSDIFNYSDSSVGLTFNGLEGDDQFIGGNSSDTYIYNIGDGNDIIDDTNGSDTLILGPGINPEDVELTAEVDGDMFIHLSDGAVITVLNWYTANGSNSRLENIQFSDQTNTLWQKEDISTQMRILGTESDNTIDYSDARISQVYEGGKGDDVITGGSHGDVYIYNLGDGNDVIDDVGGNDTLLFGQGIEPDDVSLIAVIEGDMHIYLTQGSVIKVLDWYTGDYKNSKIETIQFSDALNTTWNKFDIGERMQIVGTDADDVLDYSDAVINQRYVGGLGDDTIHGGSSSDFYVYNLGDGNDTIFDQGGNNTLVLGDGIAPADLSLSAEHNGDMFIDFTDGSRITVKDWYTGDGKNSRIRYIEFADGTRWNEHDIASAMVIIGSSQDDTFDYTDSSKSRVFRGLEGDDTFIGTGSHEKYYYALGDGNDLIIDTNGQNEFHLEDISANHVTVSQNGDDLIITMNATGEGITLQNWFIDNNYNASTIHFSDATLSKSDLEALIGRPNNTPTSDSILPVDIYEGADVNLNVSSTFTDIDGDYLTYSAEYLEDINGILTPTENLPEGLIFDGETGQFSGQFATQGEYQIKVTASDRSDSVSTVVTFNVQDRGQAPVYIGQTRYELEPGMSVRIEVSFEDVDGNLLPENVVAAQLPVWLQFDSATSTLEGYIPTGITGDFTVNLSATDDAGNIGTIDLLLEVSQAEATVNKYLADLQVEGTYNTPYTLDLASVFAEMPGTGITYTAEIRNESGQWVDPAGASWLQISGTILTGTPASLDDVADSPIELRLTANNAEGQKYVANLNMEVKGPSAIQASKLELVGGKAININLRDYFAGIDESFTFSVEVEGQAPLQAQQSGEVQETQSGEELPTYEEPVPTWDWLKFDPQTGTLFGEIPPEFVEDIVLRFTANNGDITLSTLTEFDIGEGATNETYWYTYDAAGRVIIDGGSMDLGSDPIDAQDNYITIATQGQFYSYDAAGRNTLVINNGGYNAQFMNYTDQGYLSNAFATYRNFEGDGIDLYALHKTGGDLSQADIAATVTHQYNLLGQATQTVKYFDPGSYYDISGYTSNKVEDLGYASIDLRFEMTGKIHSIKSFDYNYDGQIDSVSEYGYRDGRLENELEAQGDVFINVDGTGLATIIPEQFNLDPISQSSSDKLNVVDYRYDEGGRLSQMEYDQIAASDSQHFGPDNYKHLFEYDYTGRESYLEAKVTGTESRAPNEGEFKPSTTLSFYDASGNRYAVEERSLGSTNILSRYMSYSADGQLLNKLTGTQKATHLGKKFNQTVDPEGEIITSTVKDQIEFEQDTAIVTDSQGVESNVDLVSHYLHANNQYLGELRTDGKIQVKHQHFDGIKRGTAESTIRHQVQVGENLRSLAQIYYGNADLWYVIADANGLAIVSDEPLTAGQSLTIPQQQSSANRYDSFSPGSVLEQIGDTMPNLPFTPPPPEAECSNVATMIVIVVSVIAYAYGQQWIAEGLQTAAANAAAANTAATGATATVTTTGATATATAGITTSSALTTSGSALATVGGAAFSSVAGQSVAIGLGIQDKFSWGQVAVTALTAGATYGISNGLNLESTVGFSWDNVARGAVKGATNYAANKIIGRSDSFSWANVAASAASSAFGNVLPGENAEADFTSNLRYGFAGAVAGYAVSKLVNNEGSWNFKSVAADAFGNALGNSIVRQSINQPEPRFTGTIDTSKLDAKLAQQFGSDFNTATDKQISQIAKQTATNLTDTVTLPKTSFADITTFANSAAGVNLALTSVAQSNQLFSRLGEQAISVRNAQSRIGATSQTIDINTFDGPQLGNVSPIDAQRDKVARMIAQKQGQERRYASGLTPERYADIQGILNGGSAQVTGTPLVPVGSYSGLLPQEGNPSFEFGLLGGVSLPFAHGGLELSLAIDPNGDTYFNYSGYGGLDAQADWTEWNGNTGFSVLRTFDGSAEALITGKSIQHTLTLDAIDFGATSLDFSLALGETLPEDGSSPVHFEGFETGLNFGKKGFLNKLQCLTNDMSPLMRNGNYSTSLEIAPQNAFYKTNFGEGAYEFAQSTFSTLDDIYKGAAVVTRLIFQSPASFAAPPGVNPYYIHTHNQYQSQSQLEQILKEGK